MLAVESPSSPQNLELSSSTTQNISHWSCYFKKVLYIANAIVQLWIRQEGRVVERVNPELLGPPDLGCRRLKPNGGLALHICDGKPISLITPLGECCINLPKVLENSRLFWDKLCEFLELEEIDRVIEKPSSTHQILSINRLGRQPSSRSELDSGNCNVEHLRRIWNYIKNLDQLQSLFRQLRIDTWKDPFREIYSP